MPSRACTHAPPGGAPPRPTRVLVPQREQVCQVLGLEEAALAGVAQHLVSQKVLVHLRGGKGQRRGGVMRQWGRANTRRAKPAPAYSKPPLWLPARPPHLAVVDLLLDGARSDQPVDDHLALLPDAPRPLARLRGANRRGRRRVGRAPLRTVARGQGQGCAAFNALVSGGMHQRVAAGTEGCPSAQPPACLHVGGGVPVWVVEQHSVGARQVDAQPPHARGQQEAEHCGREGRGGAAMWRAGWQQSAGVRGSKAQTRRARQLGVHVLWSVVPRVVRRGAARAAPLNRRPLWESLAACHERPAHRLGCC